MLRRWMPSEDIAVRLADALDAEDGGRRLLEIACGRPGSRPRTCGSSPTAPASHNGIFR